MLPTFDIGPLKYCFSLYKIGTAFNIRDIMMLLQVIPKEEEDSLHISRTALLMLDEIYLHWFAKICTVKNCVIVTELVCSNFKLSICSVECKRLHNCKKKL